MAVQFASKADTLAELEGKLANAIVLPQLSVSYSSWKTEPCAFLELVGRTKWCEKPLIVRSSACGEDSIDASHAGKFLSVADVSGIKNLREAIERVFASYNNDDSLNQVLLQPMLFDVSKSGVAFSLDPSNGAPYIVVNYDDTSGKLDTVTNGSGQHLKTYFQSNWKSTCGKKDHQNIVQLLAELQTFFPGYDLDVEFAQDKVGNLYLLQVRPLVSKVLKNFNRKNHHEKVKDIASNIKRLSAKHPYLLGEKGIFGVMPDWNPAEMIGLKPRPLALSLYKELITDSIWAYQRHNYGYRNLRSFPLLVCFGGLPYIDVRVSFNSFIPASLDENLAAKLVEIYLQRLRQNPNYHDKVEFEIVHSCYTPRLEKDLRYLVEHGFEEHEIALIVSALKQITDNVIYSKNALWLKDLEKIEFLKLRQREIIQSNLTMIDKVYWLIEDCKRYGTLPFAGLARAGFIAIQLLKSFVEEGYMSHQEYDSLMLEAPSVASGLNEDFSKLAKNDFLQKYGHLRPGAYDILTPRYDESPERYFDFTCNNQVSKAAKRSDPSNKKTSADIETRLKQTLKESGFTSNPDELFKFIWGAIHGREEAKFVFTKSLSEILKLIAQIGGQLGASRDDLSYSTIAYFQHKYAQDQLGYESLHGVIEEGRKSHASALSLNLPTLITSPNDALFFTRDSDEPNFVTLLSAYGRVLDIHAGIKQIDGRIIMIPNADPGYDWLFLHNIAGFITMYGGVNSHMAIRACELGIPAVIGAGQSLYNKWSNAKFLSIDCANRTVKPDY